VDPGVDARIDLSDTMDKLTYFKEPMRDQTIIITEFLQAFFQGGPDRPVGMHDYIPDKVDFFKNHGLFFGILERRGGKEGPTLQTTHTKWSLFHIFPNRVITLIA